MQTKIEGLLISKSVYQERHIIAKVLLRSGKQISVLFYGGRGGGKKKKSSILEIGYMLKIELGFSRSTVEMYRAKEWSLLWSYEYIRKNYKAFYLLCLFLEIAQKMALPDNMHEEVNDSETNGLFKVVSNGIYYLENSISQGSFRPYAALTIFLGKLLIELGIFPQREACSLCDGHLINIDTLRLLPEHGGFACTDCVSSGESETKSTQQLSGQLGKEIWDILGKIGKYTFGELSDLKLVHVGVSRSLFLYFCYQFHFKEMDFRSLSMVL